MADIKQIDTKSNLIYIKLFGEFDLLYKGSTLLDQSSQGQKSMDILRYLIVHHDTSLYPENISDMIWPNNDYSDIRNVIRTYIFRLKRFLSMDNAQAQDVTKHISIINSKGQYKVNLSDKCDLDLVQFNKIIELLDITEDEKQRMEYLLELVSLYDGTFLQNYSDIPWVLPYRRYYETVYTKSASELLNILLAHQETDLIIKICQKVLLINEDDENVNIHYIQALLEKGDYEKAISHYNNYTSGAYSKNGRSPSDELKKLYIKLRQLASPNVTNTLDDSKFWEMMNTLLETYMDTKLLDIAIGYVTISPLSKTELSRVDIFSAMQHLQTALDFVLRKDDVFTIFEGMGAVFVLRNTNEDFFPVVSKRINEAFTEICTIPTEIKVHIKPVIQRNKV